MPRGDLYHDLVARGLASEQRWTHKPASSPHPFLLLSTSPKHTGPLLFLHVRDSSKVIGSMCPQTLGAVARWGAQRSADPASDRRLVTDAMHVVYFGGEEDERRRPISSATHTPPILSPVSPTIEFATQQDAPREPPQPPKPKPIPPRIVIPVPVSRSTPLLSPDSYDNHDRDHMHGHRVASGSSVSLATTASESSGFESSCLSFDTGLYGDEEDVHPHTDECGCTRSTSTTRAATPTQRRGSSDTTHASTRIRVQPSTPRRPSRSAAATPSRPLPRTPSPQLPRSMPTTRTATPSSPPKKKPEYRKSYSYQPNPTPYPAPTPPPVAPPQPRSAHAPISHRDGICIHYIRGVDPRVSKRTDKDVYADVDEVIRECFGRTADLREFDIRLSRRWWKKK